MNNEIVQYEGGMDGLTQWRPPETVLAEAKQAADALTRVISLKKNPVKFNNETYLEFEDWQTCAKFYGVTAKVERTAFVQYGNVSGFEATAIAVDRNGAEISRAESLCLNDEENWGMVPKYEWQDELDANNKKIWVPEKDGKKGYYKGKRVQVGEVAKPLFQLKSMAQTRACSKVLRQVFAWIVVLAGYKPTPAEEMTGHEFDGQEPTKPQVTQPQRASSKEADTKPAAQPSGNATKTQSASTTTGSTVGGNFAAIEVSGVIEDAKSARSGMLWLSIKDHPIIRVLEKDVDGGMVKGAFIKFRAEKMNNQQIGDFLALLSLMELMEPGQPQAGAATEVKQGEVVDKNAPLADDMKEIGEELFGEKKNEAVQDMVKNGDLKPASSLPEGGGKKPGTIGMKRAQRIYTLCSQNKKSNNGFNEDEVKKVLSALPTPIEHLRELETGMYEQFEKWATGEEDWREFWKD